MDSLPGDVLRYITGFLSSQETFNLAVSSKQQKAAIYDSESVWRPRIVKYLTEHPIRSKMPISDARRILLMLPTKSLTIERAAQFGCDKILEARINVKPSWDRFIARRTAIQYGHLDIILKYLPEDPDYCDLAEEAAKFGHVHILEEFLPYCNESQCTITLMGATNAYDEVSCVRSLDYLLSPKCEKYITEGVIQNAVWELPYHIPPDPYIGKLFERVSPEIREYAAEAVYRHNAHTELIRGCGVISHWSKASEVGGIQRICMGSRVSSSGRSMIVNSTDLEFGSIKRESSSVIKQLPLKSYFPLLKMPKPYYPPMIKTPIPKHIKQQKQKGSIHH